MSRISIDVSDDEHKRLKAMAALQGKSIKDSVLACTLGVGREDPALAELEALLDERMSLARATGASSRTVSDIFQQARDEAEPKS